MASIQFRFTTECEMTLHGATYEDIYLQFKDFIHGDSCVANTSNISVFPPESVQMFFDLESVGEQHEIPQFKGDYQQDIVGHCTAEELARMPIPMRMQPRENLGSDKDLAMMWIWGVKGS